MNTEQIRKGLRNIRTRAATLNNIAEKGPEPLEEILPLLQDRHDGVRWCAIKLMSEIGDMRAVLPLITLLEQSKNVTETANALRSITGQDFGDSPEEWKKWAMHENRARNAGTTGIMPDNELLATAVKDLPATVKGSGPTYNVVVSLDNQRSQQVWIDFSAKDPNGNAIVQLSTPCGNAASEQYEAALKLNMSITFGAIAIALLDNNQCFAVVDSYLRETVHPQDLAESIMSLALNGDSIEKSLSTDDRF